MTDSYAEFLARKRLVDPMTGLDAIDATPTYFKPHQADITRWALKRGRAAIFAGTGLGKTLMELEWARQVVGRTGKPVLILAPLAVSKQHIGEADKFGIRASIVRSQNDARDGTSVTNYQKLPHFDLSQFGGIVLDESSILKSTDGHYRTTLIQQASRMPFRLAATATPAPNDFMELGNHAEFLGVMSYTDMLATFFVHDGGETSKWRLKGHAEDAFWKWMASWAVMLRKPSDLGYSNEGYDLPPLNEYQHVVGVTYEDAWAAGMLFPTEARGLGERISARRGSVNSRVKMCYDIVIADWCSQCLGGLNTPRPEKENIGPTQQSENEEEANQEAANKIANICAPTLPPTRINPSNLRPSEIAGSDQNMESGSKNTKPCSPHKPGAAQSVGSKSKTCGANDLTSIIATPQASFEDCSATTATTVLENLRTIPSVSLEPWLIWCNLNSEQDALEKLFGDRCFSVRGSDADEEKEAAIIAWCAQERPVMISKPTIMGFGLNLQFCHNTIFIGASDSWEQTYQCIRRFWRFGQTKPVNAHFIAAETEGAVVANYRRKEADADHMAAAMVKHMQDLSSQAVRGMVRDRPDYQPTQPMVLPFWIGDAA